MPADWNHRRRGVGYLSAGHVQDIPVHSSAVPDSPKVLQTGTQHLLEALSRTFRW
jgi:hypothetical protein